ncbi:MAG: hypothetical protein AABX50_00035 [Nanoarchaeota archaeon]|mgnify:FL=1
MEKFFESVLEAEKKLRTVDHIVYITFPLIKDKRLLLKVIQEIREIITKCITSILQYEYMYKRINLYKNPKENFRIFTERCAPRYDINKNEIKIIMELFNFVEKHKESPFEFIKNDKIIILSENLEPTTLSIEKTKEFLITAKEILKKTKEGMKRNF